MSQDSYNPEDEAAQSIASLVFAPLLLIVFINHARFVYQDFKTPQRLSVQHRRSPPKLDADYTKGGYLTLFVVGVYTFFLLTLMIQFNFMTDCTPNAFHAASFVGSYASKSGLYVTYIFRLYQVYGSCAYAYSPKKLKSWAVFAVVVSIAAYFVHVIFFFQEYKIYDDTDGTFPWFCMIVIAPEYNGPIGGFMVLYEIIACIMSIVGFTRPLKKVVSAMENAMSSRNVVDEIQSESKKRNQKILYSGYKYKVLVITATVTTFLWIVLYVIGLTSTAAVLFLFDLVVNPVCLLLMTPYYPSNIYYERLCYLCVCCCDPQKASYRSQATSPPRTSVTNVKSLDTSQALRARDSTTAKSGDIESANPQSPDLETPAVDDADKEVTPAPEDDAEAEVDRTEMVSSS